MYIGLYNLSRSTTKKKKKKKKRKKKEEKMTYAPSLGIRLRCPHEKTLGPYLPIHRIVKTLTRLGRCAG